MPRTWPIVRLVAAFVARPATGQQPSTLTAVDGVFADYDTHTPGCALGVVRDGRLILARGYGMANLEYGIAIGPETVFRIGSTSKQFTAAAIVLLAEDGVLSLDDDIRRFLPEFRVYGRPITIRQLLNHTSGIRDYLTLMTLAGKRDDDCYTDDDVVAMLVRQRELNLPPGTEHLYSNSGYFLLSQIVKRASGQSLKAFAAARIFEPLGMTHTHFHDDHTHVVPLRATGYAPSDGDFRLSLTTLDMVGDGGVFTTVDDLLLWDQSFYHQRIGGPTFLEEMLRRGVLINGDTLDYALGLRHGMHGGLPTVSHAGAFVGYRAQLPRFPGQRFSVICLCNVSTANPTRRAYEVADVYLAGALGPDTVTSAVAQAPPGDTTQALTLSRQQLEPYVGVYSSEELGAPYRVGIEGDSLICALATGSMALSFRSQPTSSSDSMVSPSVSTGGVDG